MRHLRSSRRESLPPVAEHSLTQIPCWCARPRFPGSSAVARDRPQAARTGPGPQRWDDRDRPAMAARGAAHRAECPHSRAAARQGRRPHCGDRCCRVLRKLDHACDCCCRAHSTAPETRTSASAVPPAKTLRDRRVTGGRSGRRRSELAISSALFGEVESGPPAPVVCVISHDGLPSLLMIRTFC